MSNVVDQRVVEMRFDNRNFEKNVSTTMSTLDKLKQKLNFDGASKGLEGINTSARRVDLSPLSKGVETVGVKFNAMYTIADQVLRNITTRVQHTAEQMVKSLTIDPIKTGFSEYELKMGSIQTIMASTGESLETVNRYLNELNEYSDKTIYSFSDMTQNIGKFTNAGVKLEDAVMAMKGISNEAALSGANANEASRAMYNLAQSISMGYVQYIDWKSIENANMATVGFKQQLLDMATTLGVVKKTGEDTYETLEGKSYGMMQMFKDGMKDQWLTTDVLLGTLKDYADETTEIGAKATQAATQVKTFSQMLDTLKESAQSGWAQTWEIIFGDFYEGKRLWTDINEVVGGFIDKMNDARNSVLKGALGSTWEDFEKEINKAGLTTDKFSDNLSDVLKKNNVNVEKLTEEYGTLVGAIKAGKVNSKDIAKALNNLIDSEKGLIKSTDGVTMSVEELDAVSKRVMDGEFFNGSKRMEALAAAGYDYATVQNAVNEVLGSSVKHVSELTEAQLAQIDSLSQLSEEQLTNKGYTKEQVEALNKLKEAAKDSNSSIGDLIKSLEKPSGRETLLESFKNLGEEFSKIMDAVKEAWVEVFGEFDTDEASKGIRGLIDDFADFTSKLEINEDALKSFSTLLTGIFSASKLTFKIFGKTLLSFIQLFDAILQTFDTNILDLAEKIGQKLIDFSNWYNTNFMYSMLNTKHLANIFNAVYNGVSKCVKAFLDLTVVKNAMTAFGNVLSSVMGATADSLEDGINAISPAGIIAKLNDTFTKIETWIKSLETSKNLLGDILKGIKDSISHVGNGIASVAKNFGASVTNFISILFGFDPSGVIAGWNSFIDLISTIVSNIWDFIKAIINLESVKKIWTDISDTFTQSWSKISEVLSKGDGIAGMIEKINTAFSKLKTNTLGSDIVNGIITGIGSGIQGAINAITNIAIAIINTFKGLFDINSPSRVMMTLGAFIIAGLIAGLSSGNADISTAISGIGEYISNAFSNVLGLIATTIEKFDLGKLVAAGLAGGLIYTIKKLTDIIGMFAPFADGIGKFAENLGKTIGSINTAIKDLAKGISWKLKGHAIKSAAIGLAILVAAFVGLCIVFKKHQIDFQTGAYAIVVMGILTGVLIGLSKACEKLNSIGELGLKSVSLLALAGSIALIALAIWTISKVKIDGNAVKGIIAVLGTFLLGMWSLTNINFPANKVGGIGKIFTKLAFAMLIMLGVIKLAGMLRNDEVVRGVVIIGLIALFFRAVIGVIKGMNAMSVDSIHKVGKLAVKLSFALILMMGVIKLASMLKTQEIIKGLAVVVVIGLLFVALIRALSDIDKTKPEVIDKVGKAMLRISAAMILITIAIKIIGKMPLGELAKGTAVVIGIGILMGALIYISGFSGEHAAKAGLMMIELAAALLIISGVMFILKDLTPAEIAKGLIIVTAIMYMFERLVYATTFAGDVKELKGVLMTVTVAIGILAASIIILSFLDEKKVAVAALAINSMIGMLTLLIKAIGVLDTGKKGFGKSIATIIILAAIVGGLALLIQYMTSTMDDPKKAVSAALAMGVLLLAIAGSFNIISKSKSLAKKNMLNMVTTITVLTLFLYLLAGAILCLAEVDPVKGIAAATALGILLLALSKGFNIISNSKSLSKKNMLNLVMTISLLSLILYVLAGAILCLANIDPVKGIASATALGILLLALSKSIDIISNAKSFSSKNMLNLVTTIALLSLILYLLAGAILCLAEVDPVKGIASAIALGILLLALSKSLDIISKSKSIAPNKLGGIVGVLITLSIITAILASVIEGLSKCDPKNALINTIALTILLGAITLMTIPLRLIGKNSRQVVYGALALTAMVVPLKAFAWAISKLPDLSSKIGTIKILAMTMTAMTALMIPLTIMGKFGRFGSMAAGIGGLTAMVLPLHAFGEVIDKLPNVGDKIDTIKTIALAMAAMTALMIPLTIIGNFGNPIGMGVTILALTAMVLPLHAFGEVIDKLPDVGDKIDTIKTIALAMGAMTLVIAAFTIIGAFPVAALAGIGVLYAFVISLVEILVVMGGLFKLKFLHDFLTNGINILIQLGEGIGKAIGAFIGGIGEGIAESIVSVGQSLAAFSLYVIPFLTTMKLVDQSTIDGVSCLTKAILLLTAADFIDGLTNWGDNENSFAEVGKGLSAFVAACIPALIMMQGLPSNAPQNIKTLAEAVMLLTSADLIGNISSWLGKKMNFVDFGAQMKMYGQGLRAFYDAVNMNGAGMDKGVVEAAKVAGDIMRELQGDLDPIGGVLDFFTGTKDLGNFGSQIKAYGEGLAAFMGTFANVTINKSTVEAARDAGLMLTELQDAVNPNGGLWQLLAGNTSLENFAEQMTAYGNAIVGFVNAISGVNSETGDVKAVFTEGTMDIVKNAVQLGKDLAEVMNSLPTYSFMKDDVTLADFGAEISVFGSYIKSFYGFIADIETDKLTTVTTIAKDILGIVNSTKDMKTEDIGKFSIIKTIGENLAAYAANFTDVDMDSLSESINIVNGLKSFITSLTGIDTSGVSSFKQAMEDLAGTNINALAESFRNAAVNLRVVGTSVMDAFIQGFTFKKESLMKIASDLVNLMDKTMGLKRTAFGKTAETLMAQFINGITKQRTNVIQTITLLCSTMITTARSSYSGFSSAGKYLVEGFAAGIMNHTYLAQIAATAMVNAAEQAARDAAIIQSPSKLFMGLGKYIPQGFAIGIDKMGGVVKDSTAGMVDTAVNGVSGAIARVADAVNSDIDTQPTIRPVLDLSDVRAGAGAIDGLFGRNPSVGVLANVGTISSMMNNNQNGGNSDVVSAINKLRSELGNISHSSYQVGNVTYDDGSNVSSAVGQLIRAVKVERRI